MNDITLQQACAAIEAALEKSEELNTKMDIAVVDAGGNLKAFVRMDGAWLGSIDIACRKARTARYFDMNTGQIGQLSQPGGPLFGIEHSNGGLITFPGGVPIQNSEGVIIGAIGTSSSGNSGHSPCHIRRATWLCSRLTALQRRDRLRASTAMEKLWPEPGRSCPRATNWSHGMPRDRTYSPK